VAEASSDLWPEEIAVVTVRPPVALLKETAADLGRRTKNLVVGEIKTVTVNWILEVRP
jgi:hypothetical protein